MADNGNGATPTPLDTPKTEYFKFSPSQARFHRVMALAHQRDCPWQEVLRNAIDFYLEFQDAKSDITLTIG